MAKPGEMNKTEKRKRNKKKKSRTEVSSSSESEDTIERKRIRKAKAKAEKSDQQKTPKGKALNEKKVKQRPETNGDVPMINAEEESETAQTVSTSEAVRQKEDFSLIYRKKITLELADDLDKVRDAQDFTSKSLPMLIHALQQGESIFSAEEKRRVEAAVNV